jgi:hypothetical protein
VRVDLLGEQRGPVKCSPKCDLVLMRAQKRGVTPVSESAR